jgi:PEP-CTERM motif
LKKRTFLLLIPALFFALACSAFADTLDFTATSSFNGTPFTITFTEPSTIPSLITSTAASLTSPVLTFTDPAASITFYSTSDLGLFNIDMHYYGTDLLFEFFGDQSYTGNGPFNLLTGTFPLFVEDEPGFFATTGATSFSSDPNQCDGTFIPIGHGQVVVSGDPAATPEPGTFALLGAGLAGLVALRRKQRIA